MSIYREEIAWAAAWSTGRPYPFILAHTVHTTRRDVIEDVGAMWAREGQTPRQGWDRAYRRGIRCIRVRITEALHP